MAWFLSSGENKVQKNKRKSSDFYKVPELHYHKIMWIFE